MRTHSFFEAGAAALLVGNNDDYLKGGQREELLGGMHNLDNLMQPSSGTSITKSVACSHLKAITASKRTKPGPQQIW